MINKIFALLVLSIAIVGCSKDEDTGRELKSYVASFLNGNDKATLFGSVNVKQFLDKTGYEGNEKLKVLIGTEIGKVNSVMNLDQPLYYVIEGPFSDDGSPSAVHLFMKVKNKDSLIMELNDRSFDVVEKEEYAYTEDGDFVMGISNELAIATVRNDEYNADEVVKGNFLAVSKDEISGKSAEILAATGDVVIGLNIQNLYASSNTDLAKLDEARKKEIESMVKDSYLMTVFKFENGEASMKIDHLFSEALANEMFFRKDPSNNIFTKLNKGDGIMMAGAALNIDVAKLESFMQKYSPETMGTISSQLGLGGGMLGILGSEKIMSKLSDGQMGVGVYGNPMENSFSINTFYGTTDSGKMLFSMVQNELPPADYEYKEDGIYGNFSMSFGEKGSNSKQLKLPKGCEGFGKDGMTAFLSFQDIDFEEFGFEGEMKLVEIVDYATFTYGNEGGLLYIKAKNGKENILKQAMDVVLEQLMSNIANIAI